ncbi:MAG: class I SAM-dependent methyltransferase, partial [Thermoanaerobaculia bacterium]
DLVVMCDVLEHVPEDVKALRLIRDHLEPAGRLFLSVPFRHDPERTHVRAYTMTTIRRLLALVGYETDWVRQRPGIPEAFSRATNLFNYGAGFIASAVGFGAPLLASLLSAEFRFNEATAPFYTRIGSSPQIGGVFLLRSSEAGDYVAMNKREFIDSHLLEESE